MDNSGILPGGLQLINGEMYKCWMTKKMSRYVIQDGGDGVTFKPLFPEHELPYDG